MSVLSVTLSTTTRQPTLTATPIPVYQDNYVWVIECADVHWVVDPGDATAVRRHFERLNARPHAILVTHKHWDHTTGLKSLVGTYGIPVFGPAKAQIAEIDCNVDEGDEVVVGPIKLQVWATPGHTDDHLAYYSPEAGSFFCGDTLFGAGCGRIKEGGNVNALYETLQRIAQLPCDTLIYCAHEYTLANIEFALAVEPSNAAFIERRQLCQALRRGSRPTVPFPLKTELATNPFLRCHLATVAESVSKRFGCDSGDARAVFAALRHWKNHY